MLKRLIAANLDRWKQSHDRRVLLLRGARQVGKTSSVREFARTRFSSFVEINFLETPEVRSFFTEGSLSPKSIIEKLTVYCNASIIPGETLLFFDEIQECPEALTSLRFFYEQLPELHVVAAGSLLEFALKDLPSFGVGRIESLFMYPLSFEEFSLALAGEGFCRALHDASLERPLDDVFHRKALDLLKLYCMVGGLPKVVQRYCDTRDLQQCLPLLEDLVLGYEDDFAKYGTRISSEKLRATLRGVAQQAGSKFVYSRINPGTKLSGYDQAIELLSRAGLIYKIARTSASAIPLGAEVDPKSFKSIPFDLGIYNRLLGLPLSDLLLDDAVSFSNRAAFAEMVCGLELVAHAPQNIKCGLYYWHREAPSSSAEVDYVVQRGAVIVPLEVKAGTKGQMQSLYRFLAEKDAGYAIRTSLENFSTISATVSNRSVRVDVVPLYAIGRYVTAF
jgi:predicted AAA+ superfamily ATPase